MLCEIAGISSSAAFYLQKAMLIKTSLQEWRLPTGFAKQLSESKVRASPRNHQCPCATSQEDITWAYQATRKTVFF